jgi:hypothetical protein
VRTVFIAVHQGFAARFLLRTGILEELRRAGARVVVLTPNHDEEYIRAELEDEGVVLEPLRAPGLPTGSRLWSLTFFLRQFTLARGHRAATLQGRYANHRRVLLTERPLVGRVVQLGLELLWRSAPLRRALAGFEARFLLPRLHDDLFERHRPDLVVTTSPGWFLPDAVVLNEARRRGVRTAAAIMAWDNPTSKGYRCVEPDLVVAWSQKMADELAQLHDLRRARIAVGGVPHFDIYVNRGELLPRERLFEEAGLDPQRRLVFFAARSPSSFGHNLAVAQALAEAIERGATGAPAQLVVRPHPINLRADHRGSLDAWHQLAAEHPNVHLDVPEIMSERLYCDMSPRDTRRLASLLAHCDVLVNAFSTTTLEAFLVDRPVVLVSADAAGPGPGGASEPRRFEEDTHIQALVDRGAARVAGSLDELVELVRLYLEQPELDRDARLAAALVECGPADGRAAVRVAAELLR